jgi:hypothetical protein
MLLDHQCRSGGVAHTVYTSQTPEQMMIGFNPRESKLAF